MAHDRRVRGRTGEPARAVVLLEGMFERRRFLDLLRYFAVFEDGAAAGGGGSLAKRIAGHYQFDAVNVALEETLRAGETVSADRAVGGRLRSAAGTSRGAPSGDRRVGVGQ